MKKVYNECLIYDEEKNILDVIKVHFALSESFFSEFFDSMSIHYQAYTYIGVV